MPTEELAMPAQGGQPPYQEFMQPMPVDSNLDMQNIGMTENDTLFHCNRLELEALNKAQGKEIFEPNLGLPMFNKLWDLIKSNPEIGEAIHLAFQGYYQEQEKGKINHELNEMVEDEMPIVPQIDLDRMQLSPELEEIRNMGKGKDKELAIMPKDMLYFIWEGIPSSIPMSRRVNDKTNLPQFILGGILSILGGIVGNIFAPGIGTALGAALGNFGGEAIENIWRPEEEKKSLLEMLGGSALAGGMGMLGGSFIGGGMEGVKAAGLTPWLIAGGGGILKEQGENSRKQQNFHNQENARLNDYRNKMEQHRLQEIERERKFSEDRKNAYKQFIARYRPNLSGLAEMNRSIKPLEFKNQYGETIGSTFGYGED